MTWASDHENDPGFNLALHRPKPSLEQQVRDYISEKNIDPPDGGTDEFIAEWLRQSDAIPYYVHPRWHDVIDLINARDGFKAHLEGGGAAATFIWIDLPDGRIAHYGDANDSGLAKSLLALMRSNSPNPSTASESGPIFRMSRRIRV